MFTAAILLILLQASADQAVFEQAVQMQAEGRCQEAVPPLTQLAAKHPRVAAIHALLGQCWFELHDHARAEAVLRRAANIKPDHAMIRYFLGTALGLQGKRQEAETELRLAQRLNPNFAPAYRVLGMFQVEAGRLTTEARDMLRQATRLDPSDAQSHYWLGRYYLDSEQPQSARVQFEAALELQPGGTRTRLGLAQALYELDEIGAALVAFEAVLAEEPDSGAALLGRARCRSRQRSLGVDKSFDPAAPWGDRSEYAGSKSCAACHADIYQKQERSHHARSLRPIGEVAKIISALPYEIFDSSAQARLQMTRAAGGGVKLTAEKDSTSAELELLWAFGGGKKGITPVGRTAGGAIVESRLSWYSSLGRFDVTAGAGKIHPTDAVASLGRIQSENDIAKCFGCHTTRGDAEALAPDRDEMGIRCERCHGPGLEHIRAVKNPAAVELKILHPRRLIALQQVRMCGSCHGAPPSSTDFAEQREIELNPNTVRFPSRRLPLSRCFSETEGGLSCMQCHDPHQDGAARGGERSSACIGCHSAGARDPVTVCSVAKDHCVSCHMPTQSVMRHSAFVDHWIRVVRGPISNLDAIEHSVLQLR